MGAFPRLDAQEKRIPAEEERRVRRVLSGAEEWRLREERWLASLAPEQERRLRQVEKKWAEMMKGMRLNQR